MREAPTASFSLVLGVAMMALACGHERPLAPFDSGTVPDATARDELDAASEASTDGFCAAGDQLCNTDPSERSAHCVVVGDPPIGFSCECNPGFARVPLEPRCRAGATPCLAAAAENWPILRPLDHSDCEARTILECQGGLIYQTKQSVSRDLDELIKGCHNPFARYVRIEFAGGCPSLLEIQYDTAPDEQIADCLVGALATKRWRCAEDPNACELYEYDDLLP